MKIEDVTNWATLIEFLEGWSSANGDPDVYDVNGMLLIVSACLRNLAKHSLDADFEEIDEFFDANQIEILKKILAGALPAA